MPVNSAVMISEKFKCVILENHWSSSCGPFWKLIFWRFNVGIDGWPVFAGPTTGWLPMEFERLLKKAAKGVKRFWNELLKSKLKDDVPVYGSGTEPLPYWSVE